jgi:hypothetical protein
MRGETTITTVAEVAVTIAARSSSIAASSIAVGAICSDQS